MVYLPNADLNSPHGDGMDALKFDQWLFTARDSEFGPTKASGKVIRVDV